MKVRRRSHRSLEMLIKLFRDQPVHFFFSVWKVAITPIHPFEGEASTQFARDGLDRPMKLITERILFPVSVIYRRKNRQFVAFLQAL